jgi:hypothetical protein
MSDLLSRAIVGFAKHASAQDFTVTPGAFAHLLPQSQGFLSPEYLKLSRPVAHPQNKLYVPVRGPLDLKQAIPLENIITGLSGNNGGAIASATTSEIGSILDVVFGTAATDPAGAATTATGGVGASKTLAVTEMGRFPVGTVIAFVTTAPVQTVIRQVRARAGGAGAGNLTLDRIYTGTVTNGQTVLRAARWVDDPGVYEHIHAAFFAEYDNDRRLYLGGMSRGELTFPRGAKAMLKTSWRFTDVQDVAETDPAFVDPTRGSAVMNSNSFLMIGDVAYTFTDVSFGLSGSIEERAADNGPHGVYGYTVQKGEEKPRAQLHVKILRGTNTLEVKDSGADPFTLNKAQAYDVNAGDPLNVYDIAFGLGQVSGAAMAGGGCYGVLPAAYLASAKETPFSGYKMIDAVFEASTPSAAGIFPFEFHLL